MPVTELATLRLKPGKGWNDIISHICVLEREQAAWSGYPLYFFDVADSHDEFILLSGWRSVDAHNEWIASEMNQKLLVALGPCIDVASLLHLTIEPSEAWKDARGR